MNLFTTPTEAADVDVEPVVDAEDMQRLQAELTATLDRIEDWQRRDCDSAVSAGRADGSVTIVGNSGGWWLVRSGPGDKLMAEQVPSARDALEAVKAKS